MTALAAVASYLVADFLRLPEAYWAVISSIIVMQSSVGATVGASWNRLAGTGVGAMVGAVFGSIWGDHVLAFGIAVGLTVWLCSLLGLLDSYRLAGVTVGVVMLFGREEPSYWVIAVRRFLEVSVGIVVSLVVMGMTWSSRARKRLREKLVDTLIEMSLLYEAVLRRWRNEGEAPIDELRGKVRESLGAHEVLLKQASFEPAMGIRPAALALWGDHLRRIYLAIEALELAMREGPRDGEVFGVEPELGRLVEAISAEFHALANDLVAKRLASSRDRLEGFVMALDRKMAEAGHRQSSHGLGLEEALRFYAFVSSLRSLARELDLAREAIQLPSLEVRSED